MATIFGDAHEGELRARIFLSLLALRDGVHRWIIEVAGRAI
jgi:hypothetical protein